MKIALLGYGKMGKAIEALAIQKGHTVIARIDTRDSPDRKHLSAADVAIEFSQPDAVVDNLKACFQEKVPVVCGTTGWLTKRTEIEESCTLHAGTFFYASNFSLGVNILFQVNEYLARIMNQYPAYQITLDEIHHTQKLDSPSGTAITLADAILAHVDRKKNWINNNDNVTPENLVINSLREDPTPGTHIVKYSSTTDSLEIKHTAHSRDGFVRGALLVAEWIRGKKGILGMTDFLKL